MVNIKETCGKNNILKKITMLDFEEYKEELRIMYPNFADKQLKEIFELRVKFWEWLIDNFDLFFNVKNDESNHIL